MMVGQMGLDSRRCQFAWSEQETGVHQAIGQTGGGSLDRRQSGFLEGSGLLGMPAPTEQGQRQSRRQGAQGRCKHQEAKRQGKDQGQGEERRRRRGGELRASRCHGTAPTETQSFSSSSAVLALDGPTPLVASKKATP